MNRDEKGHTLPVALMVCAAVYAIGAVGLAGLDALLGLGDDVSGVLSVLLLLAALMAAVVLLLQDKRRNPGR